MKSVFRLPWAIVTWSAAAHAHPGHVHVPGPVHGYAWSDLAWLFLALAVLPAACYLAVRINRRRR